MLADNDNPRTRNEYSIGDRPGLVADEPQDEGECPPEYLATPAPLRDTATTVEREVFSAAKYNNFCSTYRKMIRVRLPRIRFIDGPYRPRTAANDNQEYRHDMAA